MPKGIAVVLESTTYPGTTDVELRQVLENGSGLVAGKDFHLAYSPEREDPGNPNSKVEVIPKVIGGLTPACLQKTMDVLRDRHPDTGAGFVVPGGRGHEAAREHLPQREHRPGERTEDRLRGNGHRRLGSHRGSKDENPSAICRSIPDPGLAGIAFRSILSISRGKRASSIRIRDLSNSRGEVNTSMPMYVIEQTIAALNSHRKPVNGSRILILGLAYKPNVDDDRESPSYKLLDLFKERGGEMAYYGPLTSQSSGPAASTDTGQEQSVKSGHRRTLHHSTPS